MQVKVEEFNAINNARNILLTEEVMKALPEEKKQIIIEAEVAMLKILKRYKKDNERQKNYVADKRKIDKDFARSGYDRKYFMVRVLKTDNEDFTEMVGHEFKAKKDGNDFLIKFAKKYYKVKAEDVEIIGG